MSELPRLFAMYVLYDDPAQPEVGRRFASYSKEIVKTELSAPYHEVLKITLSPEQAREIIHGLWTALRPEDRPVPVGSGRY